MEKNPGLTILLNQEEYEMALNVKDEIYHGMDNVMICIDCYGNIFYNTYKAQKMNELQSLSNYAGCKRLVTKLTCDGKSNSGGEDQAPLIFIDYNKYADQSEKMKDKDKIKLYEKILEKHGYVRCEFCHEPIIDKNNKVNIVREKFNDGDIVRSIISSHHRSCVNMRKLERK